MIIFLAYTIKVLPAYAIQFEGGTGTAITFATISIGEIFSTIVLFVCVPVAFGGFILRLLGFQKQGEGSGWKFHFGQAIIQFIKYLIYHGILVGALIVLAEAIQSSRMYYINTSNPSEVLVSFISKGLTEWLIVLTIPVVFSLFWTWVIFRIKRNYNPLVIPPTFGTYIRSILWGIFFSAIFIIYLGTIGNELVSTRML